MNALPKCSGGRLFMRWIPASLFLQVHQTRSLSGEWSTLCRRPSRDGS